jgi:endonuclease/exonuclease/phosphatase (EEP) superfamily protein YafD
MRFLAAWGVIILWGLVLLLVAWNLARIYPGDRWLPVRLGSYFAPWLMVAALVGFFLALIGRRAWLARVLGVVCLVFVVRYWPVLLPRLGDGQAVAEAPATRLRVMTFNVHYDNDDLKGVAAMLRAANPDLAAFQEFTQDVAERLLPELAADYPYVLLDDAEWPRLGLVSRYPLIRAEPPPGAWRTQRATVMTPAGAVGVWNLHSSPAVSRRGWERQRETFSAIAAQVEDQSGPVIVLGDFNTTDQAENYGLITRHLTDVHRAVGWGFGFTFPGQWRDQGGIRLPVAFPILRIDHIFVSDDWVPEEIRVIPVGPGSDHLPVLATLHRAP